VILDSCRNLKLEWALWRLAQPGDIVVDGGAKIGYATSILAARVGPQGKVHSFEPDPRSFGELQRNVTEWEERGQRSAFFGIKCCSDRGPRVEAISGLPPNYVATYEPEKTIRQLEHGL
jgi:hypothetical protein